MRNLLLILIILNLLPACTKKDSPSPMREPYKAKEFPIKIDPDTFPAYYGPNPIAGKWLIGKYARWCGNDSMVYENNNGNFVEFQNNDTVYYTYVTDGSRGWSPYRVIDAETILFDGKLQKIISIDARHFTLYHEEQNGWLREWFTLLKYPEGVEVAD